MTDSAGREFSKISFMAPFLRVSLFAEDDVSIRIGFNMILKCVFSVDQNRRQLLSD